MRVLQKRSIPWVFMPNKCFPRTPASSLNAEPFMWEMALWTSCSPQLQADVTTRGRACPNPAPPAVFFHFPLPSLLSSFSSHTQANKVKHYLSFFFFLKRKHPVQPPMWDFHLFYFQVKHADWQSFGDKQMCWDPAGVTVNFPIEALLVFGPCRHFISDTSIQMS